MMLKRIFMGLFALWVTLHLTGCDFIQSLPIPFLHKEEELTEEEAAEEEEPPSEHEALIDTKPKPVIDNYRPITVKMPDGLKIEGTLYVPGMSPYKAPVISEESEVLPAADEEGAHGGGGTKTEGEAENGDKAKKEEKEAKPAAIQYPLIILFHGLSGDRWEWQEYPRHLVNAGYAVLAIDLRGHGDSVYQGKHLKVWRQFARSDWDKMPADMTHVLKYIAKQSKFNMVNTHKVAVVGASIGANVGLTFAHLDSKDVKAAVLLSPGLEYQGIKTEEVIKHFKTPIYLLASTEDAYAADSTEQLYKVAQGKKKIKIFQDLGHGIDMLNNDPELGRDILDWLKQQLPPTTMASSEPVAVEEAESTQPEAKPEPAESEKPKPAAPPKKQESPKKAEPPKHAPSKPKPAPEKPKAQPVAKPAPAKVTSPPAEKPVPKPEHTEPVKKTPSAPTPKPVEPPVSPPPPAPAPAAPTPPAPLPAQPQ